MEYITCYSLKTLIDDVSGDEFTKIHAALNIAFELENDARRELLARAKCDANIAAYIEQLQDASVLREKYVSWLLAMVNGS